MALSGGTGYASAFPDPRVAGRVSIHSFQPTSLTATASLPADLLLAQFLAKSLLSLSLFIARDWVLAQGFSVTALNALTLLAGAIGLCVWERVWETPRGRTKGTPSSPFYPVLMALEMLFSLLALTELSVLRHVMLSTFSGLWARGVPLSMMTGAGGKKAVAKNNAVFITVAMIAGSYLVDSMISTSVSRIGYAYLLAHLLLCGQRSDMLASRNGDEVERNRIHALGTAVASIMAVAMLFINWTFLSNTAPSSIPTPPSTAFSPPSPSRSLLLIASLLLAFTHLLTDTLLSRALLSHFPASRQVTAGWPITVAATLFVGYVGFGKSMAVAEGFVGAIAWTAISHIVSSDPRSTTLHSNSSISTSSGAKTPFLARLSTFYRHFRSTIKTILETPESKRIYFFLCLNLAYMVVQMVYGIWTNSLGLISDSIHMFFDCLALGMGLFASVMATWRPNAQFTYGYSRVETLSGFANGLFLCLISIFIVFEAIERLLSPPEMNTSQLLVVSTVGLAVNLVGMAATGHHHHGHSHGGHDHGHDHAPQNKISNENGGHNHAGHSDHDHSGHDHDDHAGHSHAAHGHSHNMKGVFLHVMADTLGSVGVIISTLLINQYGWTGFDPLASIFIAVLIFASVVPLVTDAGRLLVLDMGDEREGEVKLALQALNQIEGLASYSAARFWSKDPSAMIGSLSIHLAPSPSSSDPNHLVNVERVTERVHKVLRGKIGGLEDLTVQVEPIGGL